MSESFVPITPGNGLYKTASYRFSFGGNDLEIQRSALNDATGAELKGQRARSDSLPTTLSPEDLAGLAASDPATGFVAMPESIGTALAVPPRAIIITSAGNLGVAMADGSNNNAKLIAVTAGLILPLRAVQLTVGNTAGVLGLR